MVRVEGTVAVSAPLAAVTSFMVESHGPDHPRWTSDVLELEKTTPGPVAVGTKYRLVRRIRGRELESVFEVTGLEPGRRLTGRSRDGKAEYRLSYEFDGQGAATTVSIVREMENIVPRPFEGMARKRMQRELEGELERFRGILEAETPGSHSPTTLDQRPRGRPFI